MEIWEAILLGIVQGLTEFLPVSSSGHLTLVQEILGVGTNAMFFNLMVHVGTLVAVCVVFFKDILALFKKPYKNLLLLVIATIPAGICGILLDDFIDGLFSSGSVLCFTFLLTAVLLFVADYIGKKNTETRELSYPSAISMGIGQMFAILPGLSRSGTTIAVGIASKNKREDVAKFSFLMSIPVIAGGALVEIIKILKAMGDGATLSALGVDVVPTIIAMICAGISGYFAIRWMLKLIQKCNFKWFSLYLVCLSALCFVNYFIVSIW